MGRKDGKRQRSKPSNGTKNDLENKQENSTTPSVSSVSQGASSSGAGSHRAKSSRGGASPFPSGPPKPLSQLGVEEQDRYIEKVIQSLRAPGGDDKKGEYIERVINSISDLLQLEESLETDVMTKEGEEKAKSGDKNQEEEKPKEEPSEPCAACSATAKTRCTGCRLVFYCNRECQKKDWKAHKDICRPYVVAKSKDGSRILLTSRDLQADDPILLDGPLVIGPRPGAMPLCLSCYRRLTADYRCSKCGLPLCSEKCEEGGPHEELECPVVARANQKLQLHKEPADTLLDAVTPLRCLIAKRKTPQKWKTFVEKFDSRVLEVVGGSESSSDEEKLVRSLIDASPQPELQPVTGSELHQILGLLRIYNIPTKLPYADAQGLFPSASLLSHSCIPNTKLRWDNKNGKLRVTSAEAIPRGTTITTIYTDILWGTRARRDHLRQTRMISCTCRRCKDPSEMGTYFSALICPVCPKRTVVLPQDPLDNNSPWKCSKCEHKMDSREALEQTLSLGAAVSEGLQSPSISSLEFLHREWIGRFHLNHYHLLALKHSLLQLYGREQEKAEEKDERHWEEMAKKERACKEFLHVVSLLDPALGNTVSFVGLAFFEYHKTILQSAKRNFGLAKLNALQLKKRMLLSKELLKKAMDMFQEEAPDTPEGQLFLICKEETVAIGKWMLAVGLV